MIAVVGHREVVVRDSDASVERQGASAGADRLGAPFVIVAEGIRLVVRSGQRPVCDFNQLVLFHQPAGRESLGE
jgi:hypothetical protein